jgi:hypothetical protein
VEETFNMKALVTGTWLLAASAGFGVLPAAAATPPTEVRWNELAALVVGHHVSIPLPGGDKVEGEALIVRDGSLLVDIGTTSSASRYPKGQTPLPRASLTEVRVTERRSTGGRILGTALGALVGMVAGGEIAAHGTRSEAAVVSTFTVTAAAGTVAGFFIGRSADRHTRLLRIAPEVAGGTQ